MNEDSTPKLCECGCGEPTWIATKTNAKRGWVKGEAVRWRRGHAPVGRPALPFESYWRSEERGHTTPCWIWIGGLNQDGYGCINRDGYTSAHRYSWFRRHGPIPAALEIDHLCRVRCCVNPDHMELVTRSENVLRGVHARLNTVLR